jgi:predicted PurR-regulated permease PerM
VEIIEHRPRAYKPYVGPGRPVAIKAVRPRFFLKSYEAVGRLCPEAAVAMRREHIALALFIVLIVIACYLFYTIFRPFLASIIWGAVLAGVFYPLNALIAKKLKRNNLRALIMCIVVVAVIIVPAVFLTIGLIGEATEGFPKFKQAVEAGQLDFILKPQTYGWNEKLKEFLGPYVDTSNFDLESIIAANIQRLSTFLLQQVSNFIGNFSAAIVSFAFTVLSMFFFFRDGDRLALRLKELLPMSEELKQSLTVRLKQVTEASIYGGVLVAAVQGILGGIIFWVTGLPSPIFWGTLMAILSLIPIVGPYIIYLPAAVILFVTGSWIRGCIVLGLGVLVVSQSDNVLRPVFVSSRTKIHTLVLFFSILGGLKVFGLLGVILGPVVASVVFTFLEIYKPTKRTGALGWLSGLRPGGPK